VSIPGLAILSSLLAIFVPIACADTISLGSFATGTTAGSLGFSASETAMNFAGYTAFSSPPAVASTPALQSGTASTYALSPGGAWAGPIGNSTWIGSTPQSGPGGVSPAYGYYQFNTAFTAGETGPYSGSIDVMGDDTVQVLLNGVVIVPFAPLGSDAHCADTGPTCSGGDIVALDGVSLLSGADANTLTFIVEQAGDIGSGSDPSGLDFSMTLAAAPEPGSLLLLGTGLLAGAALLLRRRLA